MYYQLPNGKTVWLELSDVLTLSKEDIQYLLSVNSGEYIHNPFSNSFLSESSHDFDDSADEIEDIENELPKLFDRDFYDDEDFDDYPDDINLNDLENN